MSDAAFPWNISNLLGGRIRALYAQTTEPLPAGPDDIFAQTSVANPAYAPAGTWKDFGGGRDASSYGRSIAKSGWELQQAKAAVVEQVSSVTRRLSLSIAEITPEILQIVEVAPAVGTLAAAANVSAFKEVGMGGIDALPRYRVAFVSQRDPSAGKVIEPAGGAVAGRGRFVVGVGWECSISADEVALEQAKATMSALTVQFDFYPVSGQPEGKEYGTWWLEQAGTIAAA
jgi:hypothetical protein